VSPKSPSPLAARSDRESSNLTGAQLAALQADLMLLQEQKRAQLRATDDPVAVDDQVTRVQNHKARESLKAITDALERIAQGTYGRCVHCSTPIGIGRLEIVPHTDSCIVCRVKKAEQ
jgi:RNA polymerase-binding transcription factor DksA